MAGGPEEDTAGEDVSTESGAPGSTSQAGRGGGQRPLGIPTIRDRVVQTAAKLVLEPIFEADFEASAYGYRPNRSAQAAVQEVHRALCAGYTEVVDADLSKYFDTIPHQELLQSVARRVADGAMLRLLKGWLKVPVEARDVRGRRRMSGGKRTTGGTPQGGVISPLLSRGHATEALAWTRWAMGHLKLTLNDTKTCVRYADREAFDFLGYTFGWRQYRANGRWYLAAAPSTKSVQRVKAAVRARLRPGNQAPWAEVGGGLNRLLRGWGVYFSYGTRAPVYRAVDHYVYQAVRHFLSRRHKVPTRGTRRFAAEQVFGSLGVLRLRALPRGVVRVP